MATWIERLSAADIPCSPLYDYSQVLADPHVVQSGLLTQVELPGGGMANALASAVSMSGFDVSELRRPPRLGESNAEVLEEWTGIN
jgi:crotonobetainyl-CoA:carnitine CoA-transferase CaiB-like acyl-CoA transferase